MHHSCSTRISSASQGRETPVNRHSPDPPEASRLDTARLRGESSEPTNPSLQVVVDVVPELSAKMPRGEHTFSFRPSTAEKFLVIRPRGRLPDNMAIGTFRGADAASALLRRTAANLRTTHHLAAIPTDFGASRLPTAGFSGLFYSIKSHERVPQRVIDHPGFPRYLEQHELRLSFLRVRFADQRSLSASPAQPREDLEISLLSLVPDRQDPLR
jgi:hypothetical protein